MKRGIVHVPTKQEHQDKQSWIQFTLSDLEQSQNKSQHADWIVTIAFYKALHAVDSYLAKLGIHPKSHVTYRKNKGRNEYVQNHLGKIYTRYYALYRASRRARYDAYTYQVNRQQVTRLVNHALYIEKYINTLL